MIPEGELEDGRVYWVRSRNLQVAAWRARTRGFVGIRQKFDHRYLFEEYHHDTGPPFGTAHALGATDLRVVVPESLYGEEATALQELLEPLQAQAEEEYRRESARMSEERQSLAYRPTTREEHEREQRIEGVRQWRQREMEQQQTHEEKVAWSRRHHGEYVKRLEAAIKGEEME